MSAEQFEPHRIQLRPSSGHQGSRRWPQSANFPMIPLFAASRHKEAVQNASRVRRWTMSLMTKHLQRDSRTGWLSFRRAYPEHLRQFIPNQPRELKRSLGAKSLKDREALRRFGQLRLSLTPRAVTIPRAFSSLAIAEWDLLPSLGCLRSPAPNLRLAQRLGFLQRLAPQRCPFPPHETLRHRSGLPSLAPALS